MARPEPLSPDALRSALADLPQWTGDGTAIRRDAELPSFRAAVESLVEVADAAEEMDHHPDVDLRWRTLRFTLSTHSAGGVTELDLQLARRIDDVVGSWTSPPDPDAAAAVDAVFAAARRRRGGGTGGAGGTAG